MRILIDITNAPHVAFFVPFIRAWKRNGHSILVTCRDHNATTQLLQLHNIPYRLTDSSHSSTVWGKIKVFVVRVVRLARIIREWNADVTVTQSSFYLPVSSRLAGVPCLYTNDNEHALGNLFGFAFASIHYVPECTVSKLPWWANLWGHRRKTYPGVKETIYLSPLANPNRHDKNVVYYRPPPVGAQYYRHKEDVTWDQITEHLPASERIIVLPRNKNSDVYRNRSNVTVSQSPLKLQDITANAKIFLGAGGSMSRELAVLGVPTVSLYDGKPLAVDRFLEERGILLLGSSARDRCLSDMIQDADHLLSERSYEHARQELFKLGDRARQMILSDVTSIALNRME